MRQNRLLCILFILISTTMLYTGCKSVEKQKSRKEQNDLENMKSYSSGQLQAALGEYLKDKTNVLGTIVNVNINGEKSYVAANGYIDSSRTTPIKPNTRFFYKNFVFVLAANLSQFSSISTY